MKVNNARRLHSVLQWIYRRGDGETCHSKKGPPVKLCMHFSLFPRYL